MYLKQKIIFSEKANGTIFRMVMKNNPANFVFELLFNQGAKALTRNVPALPGTSSYSYIHEVTLNLLHASAFIQ